MMCPGNVCSSFPVVVSQTLTAQQPSPCAANNRPSALNATGESSPPVLTGSELSSLPLLGPKAWPHSFLR